MTDSSYEEPVFFPSRGDTLFGIHAHATAPARGVGIILIQGGDDVNPAMSRNRISVHMSRQLAEDGYDVFRFTYHGVGESTGVVEVLHLDQPFVDDVVAASEYLASQEIDHYVLLGSCFGSRTALSSGPHIPGTAGLVLVTPPSGGYERSDAMGAFMARNRSFADYVRRALSLSKIRDLADAGKRRTYFALATKKLRQVFNRSKAAVSGGGSSSSEFDWVSKMLVDPLDVMVDRGVPILFSFGTHDDWLAEFREASKGPLGPILERGRDTIDVIDDLPGVAHGLARVSVQEAFLETTVEWLHRRVPGSQSARQ